MNKFNLKPINLTSATVDHSRSPMTYALYISTFVLTFIFIFSFMSPVHACNYREDPEFQAQKDICDGRPGYRWDCSMHRCTAATREHRGPDNEYGFDTLEMRERFEECRSKETKDDRRKCFLAYAQELAAGRNTNVSRLLTNEAVGSAVIHGAYVTMGVLSGNSAFRNQSGLTNFCPSRSVMGVTSGVGLAWEAKLQFKNKKELEKIAANYRKRATQESPFEAQADAIKHLKKQEDEVRKFAEERIKLHKVMQIGYAASTALALYEMSTPTFNERCGYGETDRDFEVQAYKMDGENKVPIGDSFNVTASVDSSEAVTNDFFVENADSLEIKNRLPDGADGFEVTDLDGSVPWYRVFRLQTPAHVAIASGVGLGINLFLERRAGRQVNDSEQTVKYFKALLATFEESVAGFCPHGRNDMSNPECYCYTVTGERNPNRTNSDTCKNYWEQQDNNIHVAATDYSQSGGNIPEKKGCLFYTGKYDPSCQCRSMKDDQGRNACYKAPAELHNFTGLAQGLGLNEYMRDMEKLASGEMSIGELNHADLEQRAARVRRGLDQILERVNQQRARDGQDPLEINPERLAMQYKNEGAEPLSSFAQRIDPFGLAEDKSENKSTASTETSSPNISLSGGRGLNQVQKSESKNSGFDFNFSNSGRSNAGRVDDFPGERNFNYKNDDIVTNDGASLWNIITHRYNTSGLRRLFPDEQEH